MEIWESLSILALEEKKLNPQWHSKHGGGNMRVAWLPEAKEEHREADADGGVLSPKMATQCDFGHIHVSL